MRPLAILCIACLSLSLAYGQDGPKKDLYRVRFDMAELWGPDAETPTDTLDAELYAHWLEPAE